MSQKDPRGAKALRTFPIMEVVTHTISLVVVVTLMASTGLGQTPQPFPRPGEQAQPQRPATPQPPPPAQTPASPKTPPPAQPAVASPIDPALGVPVYPTAQMIASYDAGRGQRYVVFGTTSSFAEIVTYYRTYLEERGTLVFKEPPTHMFEVGRFREETMAFPPGVTVKDWTWGGSQGYPNPKPGAQPARFPTIIIVATPPPAAPAR